MEARRRSAGAEQSRAERGEVGGGSPHMHAHTSIIDVNPFSSVLCLFVHEISMS